MIFVILVILQLSQYSKEAACCMIRNWSVLVQEKLTLLSYTINCNVISSTAVKLSLCLIRYHAVNTYHGMEVQVNIFLT